MRDFLGSYFDNFNRTLKVFVDNRQNRDCLEEAAGLLKGTRRSHSTIYLIGNGGSSAIAEHMAIDLTKNAGLRAMAISGSQALTTFSNDYGYDRVFQKAIEHFAYEKDVLIAISSGGESENILNACRAAKDKRMKIITFSGFRSDNPLRKEGHINFWVDSSAYGYIEIMHNLLIHYLNDRIIGSPTYKFR